MPPSRAVNSRPNVNNAISIPNVVLKSAFKLSSDALHISLVNCGSIFKNIDNFRRIYENSGAHVIVVPESWLKSYRSNVSISLSGYDILRNDRIGKRSGGVVIYVKRGIKTKVVKKSLNLKSEYLFAELIFPNLKILIAAYYKAPKVDEIDELNDVLAELTPNYSDVILMGDFNENLLRKLDGSCSRCTRGTCSRCRFKYTLDTYGLSSLGSQPTNFDQTPTLIDLILTNSPSSFLRFGQVSSTLSNHDILFASFSNHNLTFDKKPQFRRNFNAVNVENLLMDARNSNLEEVFQFADINSMTENFSEKMVQLLDAHAPLIPYRPKSDLTASERWYTSEIDRAAIDAEMAKREYKLNKSPESRRLWHRLRNKVNELIKYAKLNYFGPKLNLQLGSKRVWDNAKSLGIVSSKKNDVRPNFTADEFNQHVTAPLGTLHTTSRTIRTNLQTSSIPRTFAFRNVTHDEVALAVMSVKSNAVGLDKIPLKFIKLLLPVILPIVTHIINSTITSSHCPRIWKRAKVYPVHKKTNGVDLSDFRSISILPALSKVLEILLKVQIRDFLRENKLIRELQSGFRSGHSTATALMKVTCDIKNAMDKKMTTVLLLLDFSKAFDSVDHNLLLDKLQRQFNFESTAISLIKSYLAERVQTVCVDGELSSFRSLNKAVPQGSILGPLLFSLFINDLPESLKYMMHHMFADDVQIYKSFKQDDSIQSLKEINEDLKLIQNWADSNNLMLNVSKTQAIAISSNNETRFLPPLWLNGLIVPYSDRVKNLGMFFNKKLDWTDHAQHVCDKVHKSLRSAWPRFNVTPQSTRAMLAKSLLLPHFDYCCVIYSFGLNAASKALLERAYGSVIRFVYGVKKYDSIRNYSERLLGFPLMKYFSLRGASFIYKLINSRAPTYLNFMINWGTSRRTGQLIIPRHSTHYGNSLAVKGVAEWNMIPLVIRSSRCYNEFRAKMAGFLKS